MKKRTRKLTLAKETLRHLSERMIDLAVGGATARCTITEDPNCTASGCPSNWTQCC